MIPTKTSCPTSWTREYYGYLMSEYRGRRGSTIECIDEDQESIPGSGATTDGMPCPPYDATKELTCVVCTK